MQDSTADISESGTDALAAALGVVLLTYCLAMKDPFFFIKEKGAETAEESE